MSAHRSSIRVCAALAMTGGVLWTLSWAGNMLMEFRIATFFGWAELHWRVILHPAILFLFSGLYGLHALHSKESLLGKMAVALCGTALLTMLAGNVMEFWGNDLSRDALGWKMLGIGFMTVPASMVLLGVSGSKTGSSPAWAPGVALAFGAVMMLLLIQGVVILLVTGDSTQEGWMVAPILTFGLGWTAVGYALWCEAGTRNASSVQSRRVHHANH